MPPARDYVPQLATLVKAPPSGEEWWHEIKFDGYRIGCRVDDRGVTLVSRNGKDWTAQFPEVVAAVRALKLHDALLDGEIAVLLPDGRTSFQALQNAMHQGDVRATLVYFVFDLLRASGQSFEDEPLSARKARLERLIGSRRNGRIRLSEHIAGDGGALLARACALGLEGIISKRADRPYHHGRNSDWVKSKCLQRQELVIGGFTDPEGARAGLGALLLGYMDGGRLIYAGKVGTGFTQRAAADLRRRLDTLERPSSPFDVAPPRPIARRAHWVAPKLVCEVSFTEWTTEGMARHPVFQGLRADKRPQDVRREMPAPAPRRPSGTARANPTAPRGSAVPRPARSRRR
jgi:bifunctional non-homologous end joining protein LigD